MNPAQPVTENKPKSRLGRGLSSLMAAAELPVVAIAPPLPTLPGVVTELRIDQISVNPHQPRRHFDQTLLGELAESIRSNGIIQPLIVRQTPDGYQLIAGERRWRAAQAAGLSTVPVRVSLAEDWQQSQWALVENIHRSDLNPIERAEAYAKLMSAGNLTQQELADKIGDDRSAIANHLRLLELPKEIVESVRSAQLSLGHAKVLASVSDPSWQIQLAQRVAADQLSVRALEALRNEALNSKTNPISPSPAKSAHHLDLEQMLSRQLGLKTQIKASGKGRGRLTIKYASLDQFDQLLTRLGIELED